jgi:hypothetical protein
MEIRNEIITILLAILIFSIGYIIGKLSSLNSVYHSRDLTKPTSFFDTKSQKKPDISIDDTKYVVDIKTSGLEKKYDSLGEVKKSQENINSSINKLKNLKG